MGTPFMQFYVADYVADTMHFDTEQHGAYLLILMAMWRHGGRLPADDDILAKIAKVSARRWAAIKAPIRALLTVDGDQITQKRLQSEIEKASGKAAKRSAAGKAGAAAKALKSNKRTSSNASRLNKHSPDVRSQNKKEEVKKGAAAPMFPDLVFPPWWPTKEWADFVQHRRQSGKPVTPVAAEKAIARLTVLRDQGQDPKAVLDQSALNGWRGLFAVNENRTGGAPPAKVPEVTLDLWVWRIETFYHGNTERRDDPIAPGHWSDKWGPKPGAAGCLAPPEAFRLYAAKHPVRAVK